MLCENLKRKFSYGFKIFCEKTSMHGFTELYGADNFVAKLIWFIILFIAFAITGFQLKGSIEHYVTKATATSIKLADETDIVYPPLKYCISHWYDWLEDMALPILPFGSIITALSRLTKVYGENFNFDLSEAERNLTNYFSARRNSSPNGIYTLEDFFIENTRHNFGPEFYEIFPDKSMLVADGVVYMCHVSNESNIRSKLSQNKLSFSVHEYPINSYLGFTKNDLFRLLTDWCDQLSYPCFVESKEIDIHVNNDSISVWDFMNIISAIRPPHTLFVDGYNKKMFSIAKQIRSYFVQLKASVEKWLPEGSKKCNPEIKSFLSNDTCVEKCTEFSCLRANISEENQIRCKNLTTLLLLDDRESSVEKVCKFDIIFNPDMLSYDYPTATKRVCEYDDFQECLHECNGGCEKHKWDTFVIPTVFVSTKKETKITIEYPTVGSVLLLQEIERKTWDEFIGDIGGLMGIWTGASILSVFQLFYLFCCTSDKKPPAGHRATNVHRVKFKKSKSLPNVAKW